MCLHACSSKRFLSRSYTLQQLFCHRGEGCWKSSRWRNGSSLVMWQCIGIQPMTCWLLHSSIARQLMPWQQTGITSSETTSWARGSGWSRNNWVTSSGWVTSAFCGILSHKSHTGLEGCNIILLAFNAQSCYHYSCHGLYQWQAHCPCSWLDTFPSYQSLSWTWEEDTKPLLLTHRFVRGVLHCYGYVACVLICQPFLTFYWLVLHPHHKLSYFKTAGWEQEWIEMAKDMVCDAFEWSYQQEDTWDQDKSLLANSITRKKVWTHWHWVPHSSS